MKKTLIACAVALMLLAGCASSKPGLVLSEAKPVGTMEKKSYQDDHIRIEFLAVDLNMVFVLTNKTGEALRVLWDESAFVDESGVSHRVMHTAQGLSERNQTQQPSVIAPGATLRDGLAPIDYAKWSRHGSTQKQEMLSKKSLGKKVGLLLPVQFKDQKEEYFFEFFVAKSRN